MEVHEIKIRVAEDALKFYITIYSHNFLIILMTFRLASSRRNFWKIYHSWIQIYLGWSYIVHNFWFHYGGDNIDYKIRLGCKD